MATTTDLLPRPITITRRTFGYAVNPGVLRVDLSLREGEGFTLRNRSRLTARITFPANAVLDEGGKPVTTPVIIEPGTQNDRNLRVNPAYGAEWFEYTVFMVQAEIEASAASRPGIEIVR
jgi:hypothetical protein